MDNAELFRFADSMAFYESSNNPDTLIIDNKGRVFIGLFQFSKPALQDIGYDHVFGRFLCEKQTIFPDWCQYICFAKLCVKNEKKLKKQDICYGKTIHDVFLTKSGALAACHLAGYNGFMEWVRNGSNKCDFKGTSIVDYIKRFEKFDL